MYSLNDPIEELDATLQKKLDELKIKLAPNSSENEHSVSLKSRAKLVSNSSLIQKGDVFFAYIGLQKDAREFIESALMKGAQAVIYENYDGFESKIDELKKNLQSKIQNGEFSDNERSQMSSLDEVIFIGVSHLRERAGLVADYLLDQPSKDLEVIAVTGTNGKTSISQWVQQAMNLMGKKCAVVGTLGNGFENKLIDLGRTTPDPVPLQELILEFKEEGAQALSMEVSSHALDMYRVVGMHFDSAIFTNLTRDHLDFHETMENYRDAKFKLFLWKDLKNAIINIDDEYGLEFYKKLQEDKDSRHLNVKSYGFSENADVQILELKGDFAGNHIQMKIDGETYIFGTHMIGRFNALNMAALITLLYMMGLKIEEIQHLSSKIKPTKGRMQPIYLENTPTVVVDYAHTPDALENVLKTLKDLKKEDQELICVFGCGGNRDKGKRPLMAKIAVGLSDKTIVTSDNPRFEDPEDIIQDIVMNGSLQGQYEIEVDRKKAIEKAILSAKKNDFILIAGKGHEDYQEIQGVKHHFDDAQEALNVLQTIASKQSLF